MTELEHVLPADIEKTSFSIIERELAEQGREIPEDKKHVILRAIHTTADFDYLDTLTFTMGSTGGLALIGTAAPLFTLWGNMGLADTALLVGLMGLMNAGGRAVWFIASRWWSMRIATAVMLIIETIGLWELSTSMMAAQLLIHVAACAVAFGYGGVVAFGPALLARHGLATFADNHGVHGVPALCWGLVGAAAVVATVQFGHGQVFPLLAGLCLTMAMVQACMQIDAH